MFPRNVYLGKKDGLGSPNMGALSKIDGISRHCLMQTFPSQRSSNRRWSLGFPGSCKGSRKDAEAASGNLVRPICCSSNILSSESIQTVACYHKTIFMVRCFFCRRPHLMLIEGRLKTSATQILVQNLHTYGPKNIYRRTSTVTCE